jgi:hypothetical protein
MALFIKHDTNTFFTVGLCTGKLHEFKGTSEHNCFFIFKLFRRLFPKKEVNFLCLNLLLHVTCFPSSVFLSNWLDDFRELTLILYVKLYQLLMALRLLNLTKSVIFYLKKNWSKTEKELRFLNSPISLSLILFIQDFDNLTAVVWRNKPFNAKGRLKTLSPWSWT